MIDIHIQQMLGGPKTKMFKAKVPTFPQVGDHMASDKDGFSGYVQRRMFWWDDKGKLVIEVTIK